MIECDRVRHSRIGGTSTAERKKKQVSKASQENEMHLEYSLLRVPAAMWQRDRGGSRRQPTMTTAAARSPPPTPRCERPASQEEPFHASSTGLSLSLTFSLCSRERGHVELYCIVFHAMRRIHDVNELHRRAALIPAQEGGRMQ
jgi:hypothetical protein